MILIPGHMGQLDVSNKSSRRKQRNMHLDSIPEIQMQTVENKIKDFEGDPDRLREYYYSRWAWNAWAFPEYARQKDKEHAKYTNTEQRLF
jgi:hypothetical protein